MPGLHTDWSGEVLRTCHSLSFDFLDGVTANGSVAIARSHTDSQRLLTVDEVAVLTALKTPRILPRALYTQIADCSQILGRLILDGLVEVRRNGRFRSGASALASTDDKGVASDSGANEEGNRISELALRYAVAVRHLNPGRLAERLYAFNSLPRRKAMHAGAAEAFAAQTGIDAGSVSPRIGGREWTVQPAPGWLYFRRGAPTGNRFKIYLCPQPQHMSRVIPAFAEVLGGARGSVFKIAFPSELCVRADKIVAYVASFEALQQTVSSLVKSGLDALVQAVPFSAPVPGTPLLSWGVDPPNLATQKASSWRSWLTRQVADCAHGIPAAQAHDEAFEHLKAALLLRDIDPVHWLPRQQLLSRKWSLEL